MQLLSEKRGVRAVAELSAINEQPTVVPKCTKTTPWQVRCIQAHIAANMQAVIRTADLAGIVGFSSYRIVCVFKDNLGCTPHQYLMRRRMERAQRLLLMSNDSLSQIATECGFANSSHLSNMFQRIMGERPGQWRRIQTRRNL